MKLTDFNTLAEAQAHFTTKQRRVTSDLMLKFLIEHDYIDLLESATPSKYVKGLKHALTFGSNFNFMEGHPDSVTPLLNAMVATGEVSQAFADALVDYSNHKQYPYADTTQVEFEAAKAEAALKGTQTNHTAEYPAAMTYLVKLANKATRIYTILDEVFTHDVKVNLYAHLSPDNGTTFVKNPQAVAVVSVPAGEINAVVDVKKPLSRKVQFSGEADYLAPFKLVVEEA